MHLPPLLSLSSSLTHPQPVDESIFRAAHTSILAALYYQLGATPRAMALAAPQALLLFRALGLPLSARQVADLVKTIGVPKKNLLGFHKVKRYILHSGRRIARTHAVARTSVMSDYAWHPPLGLAKDIIKDHAAYTLRLQLIKQYRAQPNGAPAFLCRSCGTRFASNKAWAAHAARRHFAAEHRELKQRRAIFDAQSVLLRHAKFLVSKRLFPAYFTLVPEKTLPLDYYPQVMDYIGEEGRPMGAIEPEMLIRVEVGGERRSSQLS